MLYVALQREEAKEGGGKYARQMQSDHVTAAAAEAADDVTGSGFLEILASMEIQADGETSEGRIVPAELPTASSMEDGAGDGVHDEVEGIVAAAGSPEGKRSGDN